MYNIMELENKKSECVLQVNNFPQKDNCLMD